MKLFILIIQGHLHPTLDAQDHYQKYLIGTGPVMKRHHVTVFAVGHGQSTALTTIQFSINAILRFPSLDKVHAFFTDPEYQALKVKHRDLAYASLELNLFEVVHPENTSHVNPNFSITTPPPAGLTTLCLSQGIMNQKQFSTWPSPSLIATQCAPPNLIPHVHSNWSRCQLWSAHTLHTLHHTIEKDPSIRLTQWINRAPKSSI